MRSSTAVQRSAPDGPTGPTRPASARRWWPGDQADVASRRTGSALPGAGFSVRASRRMRSSVRCRQDGSSASTVRGAAGSVPVRASWTSRAGMGADARAIAAAARASRLTWQMLLARVARRRPEDQRGEVLADVHEAVLDARRDEHDGAGGDLLLLVRNLDPGAARDHVVDL